MVRKRRHFYKAGDIVKCKNSCETAIVLESQDPSPHNPIHIMLVLYSDAEQAWVLDTQIEPINPQ